MRHSVIVGALAVAGVTAGAAAAQTLSEVKGAGHAELRRDHRPCRLRRAERRAANGKGFDVAFCRAVAAAVLGDPTKVNFVPTTGQTRFTALASGEIDVLARNTTWTFSRDVDLKFTFVGVNYYDGQGFMAPRALGVSSAKELDGATVCIQTGTTTELNLADFFRVNNISYEPVPIETNAEALQQYNRRRLRRLHHRRLGPRRLARHLREPGATTSSCPRSSPRSRWGRWSATATTSGPTSSAGR